MYSHCCWFTNVSLWTTQPPTIRVDTVSNAQRSRMRVDAVRNQTVENGSAFGDAFTGQQTHQMGVTVMKLMEKENRYIHVCWFKRPTSCDEYTINGISLSLSLPAIRTIQ